MLLYIDSAVAVPIGRPDKEILVEMETMGHFHLHLTKNVADLGVDVYEGQSHSEEHG